MIKLNLLTTFGFSITWKFIYYGFKGTERFREQLEANNIIDYAISCLQNERHNTLIDDLACIYPDEEDKIHHVLYRLATQEVSDEKLELRKWQYIYVVQHFPPKNEDYIGGIVELGNIWADLDFPDHSPHIFQGVNNQISPQSYYTKENYEQLYEKHLKWLIHEKEWIQSMQ